MPRTYSRKRKYGGYSKRSLPIKKRYTARRGAILPSQRGYLRTAGFYKQFTGSERKYFDTNIIDASISSSGEVLTSLNLVPQGTTPVTRIGQKITIKSIHMHFLFTRNGGDDQTAAEATDCAKIRVLVYIDKQANGAAPAVTDILDTATGGFQAFNNLANRQRFLILKDKNLTLGVRACAAGSTSGFFVPDSVQTWNWHKKCSIPVEFSSTTGAITEIRSMNIGMLFISSDSTNVTPTAIGVTRVRFTDD